MPDYGFPSGSVVKKKNRVPTMQKPQETWVQSWVWKIPWRRNGNPLQYSCLENPLDKGIW